MDSNYSTYYYSIEYQDANTPNAPGQNFIIQQLEENDGEMQTTETAPKILQNEIIKPEPVDIDESHVDFETFEDFQIIASEEKAAPSPKKKKVFIKNPIKLERTEGGRPKKGRKQKIPGQSREERKLKANTNKEYINAKGNKVQPKVFDESFDCNCPKKCCEMLNLKTRQGIFKMFWNMGTYQARCCFINGNVNEFDKKRTYIKSESRRTKSRKYYLKGQEVCKVAFCKTLQISSSRIDISLSKYENDQMDDRRGKGRKVNALSEERLEEVLNHIASFPTSDGRHLSSDLTLRKMYQLYKEQAEQPVSESSYKKQFYQNFNLKFKKIKRDSIIKTEKTELIPLRFPNE